MIPIMTQYTLGGDNRTDWSRYSCDANGIHQLDTTRADYTVTFHVVARAADNQGPLTSWLNSQYLYEHEAWFCDIQLHEGKVTCTYRFYHAPNKDVEEYVVERFAEIFGGEFAESGAA